MSFEDNRPCGPRLRLGEAGRLGELSPLRRVVCNSGESGCGVGARCRERLGGGGGVSSSSPGKNILSELLACPIGLKPAFFPDVELEVEPAGRIPTDGEGDLR